MSMATQINTAELLEELLSQRVLLLDGRMGALILSQIKEEAEFRGERFRDHPCLVKNCADTLVLSRPELIADIHRQYLAAGSDIIETNTFNATTVGLAEFGLTDLVYEINKTAVEL